MSNKTMSEILSGYLSIPITERFVVAHMIKELECFSLKDTICLHIEDNTMNGDDTVKKSWRAHLVNPKFEDNFYVEVETESGMIKSRCYILGNDDMALTKFRN